MGCNGGDITLKLTIDRKEEGPKKDKDKLMYLRMREIGSRHTMPQRLIHLANAEEKQSAHLNWRLSDYCLYLVCFELFAEL